MLRSILVLLALASATHAVGKARLEKWGGRCAVEVQHRRECGLPGDNIRDCMNRGCCWAPCHGCPQNTPWCFIAGDMYEPKCLIPSEEKDDCGFYGITRDQCLAKGCCFMPSNIQNDPWCFHALPEPTTPEPTTTTTPPPPTTTEVGNEGAIRLVNGSSSDEGRLEIYHAGFWGTICDDGFDHDDAKVACRILGLPEGLAIGNAKFGQGTGPILLDEVECAGDETELGACRHNGWGSNDCSHNEDVSLMCKAEDPGEEGDVRLVEGENAMSGRLEVYHNGEWGTVCDDSFGTDDGNVVCRQLGFGSVESVTDRFPNGYRQIWLDEVDCDGDEETLAACGHRPWGQNDCGHGEDVGLVCSERTSSASGSGKNYDDYAYEE